MNDCEETRRYAGSYAPAETASFGGHLDVATLNIEFALRVHRAKLLFERVEELARAQIVLLQEMDPEGTEAMAASLRMHYVYYPTTVHVRTGRDYGNAVLSRWPILRDEKLTLPHRSLLDRSPRGATCATVAAPGGPLEVCSLHIATPLELWPSARRAQVRAVLDRLRGANPVVLGGDFNSHRLGRLAASDAFEWTTRHVGITVNLWSVDHIFVRGLRASRVGRVANTLGASDHAAVWARLRLHASGDAERRGAAEGR